MTKSKILFSTWGWEKPRARAKQTAAGEGRQRGAQDDLDRSAIFKGHHSLRRGGGTLSRAKTEKGRHLPPRRGVSAPSSKKKRIMKRNQQKNPDRGVAASGDALSLGGTISTDLPLGKEEKGALSIEPSGWSSKGASSQPQ